MALGTDTLRVVSPRSGASRRYAFVPPRFGRGIAGGAETLVGELARHLARRGESVEVFTTCARDNRTWENEFKPGVSEEDGVRVTRFPVDPRDLEVWIPKQISISEGMRLSVDDQLDWMTHSVNSSALYAHLAAHADDFDAIFFAPYLFGTTFWGSLACPEKAILIPCLHDEHYAYVDVISTMFRQARGSLFNAAPEMELARSLYGPIIGGEVGMGFDPHPEKYCESLEPYLKPGLQYLLYVGRKETGKNVQLLIDYFIEAKARGAIAPELALVIAGGGSFSDLHRPAALERQDIIDVAHVSERDKDRLIRHAALLCQPSTNESFSIVLMESWLLGTPVLVHAECQVTRHHVTQSGGGLYFGDAEDFTQVVSRLTTDLNLREQLAQAGQQYVNERYSWDAVLERFDQVLAQILESKTIS